jgi:predicted O-methyltransferase YrrM
MILRKALRDGRHLLNARAERQALEGRFPSAIGLRESMSSFTGRLAPLHRTYTREVSAPDMAISLATAAFLRAYCERMRPRRILDLGSGFSSYVFRSFVAARRQGVAYSVDSSSSWLDRTRAFLAEHHLSTEDLIHCADDLDGLPPGAFDLVFHDLGLVKLRSLSLPAAIARVRPDTGVLILDDMHKKAYASSVHQVLRSRPHRYLSLAVYTRDQYGRHCGLVCDLSAVARAAGPSDATAGAARGPAPARDPREARTG